MFKKAWNILLSRVDVEMWRQGWWMLFLIIGSIGVLFIIGVILAARH